MKKAIVIGVAGQDGSYLAEFLLRKGYEVLGLTRFHSAEFGSNLSDAYNYGLRVMNVDITDAQTLVETIARFQPDEVYNLAALSFVGASWDSPGNVLDVNAKAVANLIQACRIAKEGVRLYQASSSEMYGNRLANPGSESAKPHKTNMMLLADDLMLPRSPYGVSKMAAHHLCRVARESHGQYVVGGICFNHESERRGAQFVTRKIAMGLAMVKKGMISNIPLGNLDAYRDWGYAPEYVAGMWRMLQQDEPPKDFILATGKAYSVRDFLNTCASFMDLPRPGEEYAVQAAGLVRPAEVWHLVGDTLPATTYLGWTASVEFEELVGRMAASELAKQGFEPPSMFPPVEELPSWKTAE